MTQFIHFFKTLFFIEKKLEKIKLTIIVQYSFVFLPFFMLSKMTYCDLAGTKPTTKAVVEIEIKRQ